MRRPRDPSRRRRKLGQAVRHSRLRATTVRFPFVTLLIVILGAPAWLVSGEPCVIGTAERDQLLDQVLPTHVQPTWASGERKISVLRFTPVDSVAGEALITFVEHDDGSVTSTARRLRRPLATQLDAILSGDSSLNCTAVIERLEIDDAVITGAALAQLQRSYRQLLNTRMRADVSGDVHLDTARYELVVNGGMERLRLVLFEASQEGRRAHPVMRSLRDTIRLALEACDRQKAK